MNTQEVIQERIKYWRSRKSDFNILLQNWLRHQKVTLIMPADTIYDEYMSTGIETFKLSEHKYGKDLQTWFDEYLAQSNKNSFE
ncbi:MAG: hypothetical protein Q9M43_12485 [Sulfurimonas sp.]|nr:hypothetical protein [Sulfurimonas sp.]